HALPISTKLSRKVVLYAGHKRFFKHYKIRPLNVGFCEVGDVSTKKLQTLHVQNKFFTLADQIALCKLALGAKLFLPVALQVSKRWFLRKSGFLTPKNRPKNGLFLTPEKR